MSTTDPLIGRQLGDYKIEELIGHGGMARVYRGFDETLDRNAAVKVIEPTLIAGGEEEEYRDRFLREARAIARLNHPNIVGIYQFAQEENLYFIAMAYLDGRDLREVLKGYAEQKEAMPQDEMLKVLHDIASGLDYAHKNDIIHRDIKPSNIIVTTEGGAVLTDFGLALNAVEGTIGNTFGSVHYIAPEQAISSAQAVAQSDQYSLAVIVYELLAGQVPFDDASAMSVALKHISDPPPPIRDLNPKVSAELEAVVMKALDKEPTNRYETVSEFIDAFEAALDDAPDALSSEALAERPVNIPPASPSMDDDAPTIDRASQASIPNPTPTSTHRMETSPNEKGGGLNMTVVVVAIVIVVGIIVGGLLAANSAAEAATATETAIARENATGTAVMIAQNATETESAIVEATTTAEFEAQQLANANATSTAEFEATQTANDNATSTAQFEVTQTANANATATAEFEATQIANANDTATAEFVALQAANETATAESEATQTANANATSTAEFEATQTANAESTSTAAFNATQTAEAPTLTPTNTATSTPSPTLTPSNTPTATNTPSPTYTPTATFTPSPSPTPLLMADEGQEQLLLRYDGRSIILTNRLQFTTINLDDLVFTKFVEDEDGNVQESDRFRMRDFTGAPSPLRYRRCLQIWNSAQYAGPAVDNPLMDDICDTDPFWRTSNDIFWADSQVGQYFEVTINNFETLATCPTNRLGSPLEMRCVIDIPLP